ncbi:MAG: proX [Microbacteriaceae bacterium]|nr:proX [Microbacteriaceae bacterium]
MQSRGRNRVLAGALAVGLLFSASGCATTRADPRDTGHGVAITVGAQDTLENRILAQLYGQVLAHHGYDIDYNEGVGDRASFIPALQSGIIDLIPDSTGALLYGADPGAFARSSGDVIEALPDALVPLKLHAFHPAEADDADAFVVTSEFSEANQVTSIGDLAYRERQVVIGAPVGFLDGRHGRTALLAVYQLSGYGTREIGGNATTALVSALLTGSVHVAVIPSTTPSIGLNGLVVLRDPKSLITAQNIVPVAGTAANRPDVRRLVDSVSAELTTDELRELNESGSGGDGPSPERVAKEWLSDKRLLD